MKAFKKFFAFLLAAAMVLTPLNTTVLTVEAAEDEVSGEAPENEQGGAV